MRLNAFGARLAAAQWVRPVILMSSVAAHTSSGTESMRTSILRVWLNVDEACSLVREHHLVNRTRAEANSCMSVSAGFAMQPL